VIGRRPIIRIACLAAILTFTFTGPLFAQILPGLGVKGGVNLATQNISGEGAGDDDGLTSFPALVAGVFMTFPLASWLELQPEVLYSVKGSRFEGSGFKSTALIDYLEVPMLARVSRRGGGLGFYAAGGPYAAFRLRARTRTTFSGATEEIDIGDDTEAFDYGLSIGGGVEWRRLVFDGRYLYGLQEVDKDQSDSLKITNRAISITAGFKF
jgi:hypothetical protein